MSQHKNLGVLLSSNLGWSDHIENIVKKAYKKLEKRCKLEVLTNHFFQKLSVNGMLFSLHKRDAPSLPVLKRGLQSNILKPPKYLYLLVKDF